MLPYTYFKKLVPHSLINIWNSTNMALKNYLKEKPEGKSKLLNAPAEKIPGEFNRSLNNFRLNLFNKSLKDSLIYNYKEIVNCDNDYCLDCN